MVWKEGVSIKHKDYVLTIQRRNINRFTIDYEVRDQNENLHFLKTLNTDTLRIETRKNWQNRLVREVQILANCKSPNIVEIEDTFFYGSEEVLCILMGYIPGDSLYKIGLSRRRKRISNKVAIKYIRQVAEALDLMHSRGFVHLNVRPQNIVIRAGEDEAVLTNFSLARNFSSSLTFTAYSNLDAGFTPAELLPSSYHSKTAKLDIRSDIYSLGATLYFLSTGDIEDLVRKQMNQNHTLTYKNFKKRDKRLMVSIESAMKYNLSDRPNSIKEWISSLPSSVPILTRAHVAAIIGLVATMFGLFTLWMGVWADACSLFKPVCPPSTPPQGDSLQKK